MSAPKLTDAEFLAAWERLGNAREVAALTGQQERVIHERRKRMEKRGYHLPTTRPAAGYESRTTRFEGGWTFPREVGLEVHSGTVIVFSDAHYWPGEPTTAHKALIEVIRRVKPRAVIANGDVFDGASVTRHDPFGWSKQPTVREELDACIDRLSEIEQAIPKGCATVWNVGNHCVRFERKLVSKVPEFAGLGMLRLEDHFPAWDLRWSTLINPDGAHPVMVKHRLAGGIHSAYNNTLRGGLSMVTGHTHLLEVKPWGDYRGRRWGIATGSLSDLHGPQFEYHENSPSAACSGFAVLTFKDGKLIPPELVEVLDGQAWFRGEVVA